MQQTDLTLDKTNHFNYDLEWYSKSLDMIQSKQNMTHKWMNSKKIHGTLTLGPWHIFMTTSLNNNKTNSFDFVNLYSLTLSTYMYKDMKKYASLAIWWVHLKSNTHSFYAEW